MEDNEDMFERAYKEYRMLSLADPLCEIESELFNNMWCVLEGRSFAYPPPHRHYTFEEFMDKINSDKDFANRFIFNRFSKN